MKLRDLPISRKLTLILAATTGARIIALDTDPEKLAYAQTHGADLALPTAMVKPFSGSAARALLIETMQTQGVDSFPALVAATVQGSTETTFYVLAVYFGAVGIQRASAGSNSLQCEQLYQKNSITSTLSAGALVATGLASLA